MAVILLVMAYHRTTYTIGFMGWYDTFQNTKINYFLFSLNLAMGPLIYLYVRVTIRPPFRLTKLDGWHFIPVASYILYRIILLVHDSGQDDWQKGYDGQWMREVDQVYVSPVIQLLTYTSQVIYYAFTIQLFWNYRQKIRQFFSNTYAIELRWIKNFLIIYTFLFVYGYLTDLIDAFIIQLDYVHNWWIHFFSAIAIVYLGIKSYFTDLQGLHTLTLDVSEAPEGSIAREDSAYDGQKEKLSGLLYKEALYLNPNLTLKDVAAKSGMGIQELSATINTGFGVNFNEWINGYRVEAVKEKLGHPDNDHLSLVAIAYDCGFNSKATFNRVFKAMTGISPSEYKANHRS